MSPVLRKHDWKRNDDGGLAYEGYDPHCGPTCNACGESFCLHCEAVRYQEILDGHDPIECRDWHKCSRPPIKAMTDTFVCPEPECGREYIVRTYWVEGRG